MAKVYWIIGQSGSGKTTLGKKLHDFLQTSKRNWRKDVFHIDDNDLVQLTDTVSDVQLIAKYLQSSSCDVVVSMTSPNRKIRENYKHEMGDDIVEIFLHSHRESNKDENHINDFQDPNSNFISVDTTKLNINRSFSTLINKLHDVYKL